MTCPNSNGPTSESAIPAESINTDKIGVNLALSPVNQARTFYLPFTIWTSLVPCWICHPLRSIERFRSST